ncbi:MAG: ethanolamine ammonia-lyase subunit EutC [Hydrogenophaga sp.]|uniref:ethanolamine ammonia-lyase subunit EutC n=1 Tax=Hydrogenophaga sp. TaxID=1904254 RepID=UPI00262AEF96|nr:ethanolamine ammonia-lyase subunit EutC [Hydrogenophaga sp.]MDM7941974.1 ethanolamine ammonia-lyase subunit EutC [Hydrogenophaga sp.]
MKPAAAPTVTPAAWRGLQRFTDARIALGRAGSSQPTAAHLAFQLAHAQARDAVHLAFEPGSLVDPLQALGLPSLRLHSAASDRSTYLQRPDLGRRLDPASARMLQRWQAVHAGDAPPDLAFVIADGLSAAAAMHHALPLMAQLLQRLQNDAQQRWAIAPVALVEQGRVAIGDEIGAALRARTVVVLIGERPGLSSPDSLGIYFTWAPQVGMNDAQRNCISNVRDAGLPPAQAAARLHALLARSRVLQLSGVALKDERDDSTAAPLRLPAR